MIISNYINPKFNIYYLASKLLVELTKSKSGTEYFTLYESLHCLMSLNQFQLSLDWLFLVDAIKQTEEGKIILCS